jgi:transcriptional regulator with XRE-family HTH domain
MARRLKISTTILYNIETNRSRIKLDVFFKILEICNIDVRATLRRHLFSVQELPSLKSANLIVGFRARLNLSQKKIAELLGYKSGSIYHHFEKGLRQPDLIDYLRLMMLAGDNIKGLVMELTEDKGFAEVFPGGTETTPVEWHHYWEYFYIPAIRHIMRTATYSQMKRYKPGFFSDTLGITYEQERHALTTLSTLNLITWSNAKPNIEEEQRIVIPKDIPKEKLDSFKLQWLEFSKAHYLKSEGSDALLTMDVIPINRAMYQEIRAKIRRLQDEIHNMAQSDTDGIAYLGWVSNYLQIT